MYRHKQALIPWLNDPQIRKINICMKHYLHTYHSTVILWNDKYNNATSYPTRNVLQVAKNANHKCDI